MVESEIDSAERTLAVDVTRSVVVQAPAGSGKTTLLLERYLRLLCIVDEPEEILVVTFTRKAAAEIRARVAAALDADDHPLVRTLRVRDDERNWGLRTAAHRLRIQTLDAFALSLARRVPIVSGLSPHGRFVEDPTPLCRAAVDRIFTQLDTSPFAAELARVLALFDNDYEQTANALVAMLKRRDQWLDAARMVLHASSGERTTRLVSSAVRTLQGHVIADARHAIGAELEEVLGLASIAGISRSNAEEAVHWRRIGELFTTREGTLRRRLDTRHGFPATIGRESKNRMLALLDRLRARDLDEVFFNLRLLPDEDAVGATSTEVTATTLALTLAALELDNVFRSAGSSDFTALTFAARRALGDADGPSDLTLSLDHRLRHLLVDEFQDTSVSQIELLTRLLEGWEHNDGRTFFAVGDPMQSIYRFRDAEVALMMRSTREGVGALVPDGVRLRRNFRADPTVIEWINRIFAEAFGAFDDPQLGRIAFAPSVAVRTARSSAAVTVTMVDAADADRQQAALVASRIAELTARHADESVAVLVRSRTHLTSLVPALDAARIRWHGVDVEDPVTHPVVRDLLTLLDALHDPTDMLAWLSVLRSPFVGLGLADLLVCARHPPTALVRDANVRGLSPAGERRLARVAPVFAAAFASRSQVVPAIGLERLWRELGGPFAYSGDVANDDIEARAATVFESIESFGARNVDNVALRSVLSQRGDRALDDVHAVQIMTIHRAKGLEFDHVLIPGLDRETRRTEPPLLLFRPEGNALLMATSMSRDRRLYDWLWREERHREAHERTRLLYVATTRARTSLHLFGCHERAGGEPAASSLLAPIWNAIQGEIRWVDRVPSAEPHVAAAGLHVLPADVEIPAPASPTTVPRRTPPRIPVVRRDTPVGRLLRRTLYALARRGAPSDADAYLRSQRERGRTILASDASASNASTVRLATFERRLGAVLADERGRWLMRGHGALQTDVSFVFADDVAPARVDIDLRFVDESGRSWIVVLDMQDDGIDAAERDRWLGQLAIALGGGTHAAVYGVMDRSWREVFP